MSLEDIEKELYSSTNPLKKRRPKKAAPAPAPKENVAEAWVEEVEQKSLAEEPTAWWAKRIVLGGVIFGVLLVGGAILFIS